ncbi:MAG: hypothetical protein HUJ27_14865 [Rhodobacteraceae bacterium]|nr:hypothetical protein [Paracoccaceae bacterium]
MLRMFALIFFIAGAWFGMRMERSLQEDRCIDMGGVFDSRGICEGLRK